MFFDISSPSTVLISHRLIFKTGLIMSPNLGMTLIVYVWRQIVVSLESGEIVCVMKLGLTFARKTKVCSNHKWFCIKIVDYIPVCCRWTSLTGHLVSQNLETQLIAVEWRMIWVCLECGEIVYVMKHGLMSARNKKVRKVKCAMQD